MNIDGIYEAARERGLANSRRRFSRDLLGRGYNYLSDRRGECSAGAILNLYKRLGELGQADLQTLAFERLLEAKTRGNNAGAVRP
jgi:hypothetical protein